MKWKSCHADCLIITGDKKVYCQFSNIRCTRSQHFKDSRTVLQLFFAESLEARCQVENEDVVGAAPTGDAPTTSEWSTILLPTKVRLILERICGIFDKLWQRAPMMIKETVGWPRGGVGGCSMGGVCLNIEMSSYPYRDTYNKAIGQSDDCLIFIMGIPIPVKTKMVLYIEAGPSQLQYYSNVIMSAIVGNTKLVPYHLIKSLQFIWWPGTHTRWRHQMETFSALLAICAGNSPVTGEFHAQRPVTRSFDVFFDLHLHERSWKQSQGWWFEMPSLPLWHHSNGSGAWSSNEFHWPDQDDRVPG